MVSMFKISISWNTIPNVTTWSVFEIFLKKQNELRIAKGSLSTSIASSAVTAAQWPCTGGNEGDAHLDLLSHSFSSLIIDLSVHIPTSHKVYSLLPQPKHCGKLVWCMLILCERAIGYTARIVVTGKQYVSLQAAAILYGLLIFETW